MSDLPLPDTVKWVSVYTDTGPRLCEPAEDVFVADQLHAYAAAKTAELQAENETLKARIAGWEQKAQNWLASPEAAQRLEGYRELAQRLNHAEAECARLRKALLVVRSGPMLDDVAPYYRAVTELNDALSDVLGEGE